MNHFSEEDNFQFRRLVANVTTDSVRNISVLLTRLRSESLGLCHTTFRHNVSVLYGEKHVMNFINKLIPARRRIWMQALQRK